MRLPVNLFLYVTSAGLLGLAGYTFYKSMKLGAGDVRRESTDLGGKEAQDGLARGKDEGPTTSKWNYQTNAWRNAFLAPNLIGKDPPKPVDPTDNTDKIIATPHDVRPLSEIIELVSLMSDSSTEGKGGQSHVIVRYRDGVDVQPPQWYLLENQPIMPGGPVSGPADGIGGRPRPTGVRPGGARPLPGRPMAPTSTPVPMSSAGQDIVQRVWVAGDGSPRNEAVLWPPFDDIRLVRVHPDARSAYFVRTPPKPKDGEPAQEPVEEQLFATSMDMPQDILEAVADWQRGDAERRGRPVPATPTPSNTGWRDVEETQRIGDTVFISRKDQAALQESSDTFLSRINVDPYVSRTGSGRRGLRVVNVAPEITTRYGVLQNDLILAVNDQPVSTKADAIAVGRRLYDRGVRTFVVRFLSGGREVDRTYQAPDR